ncbi:MAG: hypothetical protein K2M30_04600, partial [Desulfovibrionaceae bacterium]|nr:hypothetical protein [Desulfovibrionaceae bacterium]
MTVYTTHSYIRYMGDGVQTRFPISFVFQSASDIVVSLLQEKIKTELSCPQEYSIEENEGGSVVVLSQAPEEDIVIVIERRQPQIQTVGLHTNSSLDLNVLERSLDSLVLMIQEASQQLKKLQEEGEVPTTEDYKNFMEDCKKYDEYLQKALHTVTTADTAIEERYTEIQRLYEIIKDLANSGGGSSDTETTTVALTEHNNSKSSHYHSLVPTGCVSYFMRPTAPEGWLILE